MVKLNPPRLYTLKGTEEQDNYFYARDPKHIIEIVNNYREKLTSEKMKDPKLIGWAKQEPKLEDIIVIEKGSLTFIAGMISMDIPGELFEHLEVTDDFIVHVNLESLPYFDVMRSNISHGRRCNLYKIRVDHSIFPGQYFIPKDIADAIAQFDLKPYFEKAAEVLKRISEIKHPNVGVGFKML